MIIIASEPCALACAERCPEGGRPEPWPPEPLTGPSCSPILSVTPGPLRIRSKPRTDAFEDSFEDADVREALDPAEAEEAREDLEAREPLDALEPAEA